MMAGTGVNVGGAGMLRTRRRDVSVKPNRKLDRKSSRGMIYENEELRLRTIHINAEVEQGQNDIKKLRRENEQLRREIWSLRDEYDKLEEILKRQKGRDDSGEYEDRSDDDVQSDYSYEENEEIEEEEEEEIDDKPEGLNQEDEQLENAENQKISTEKMSSGSLHRLHVDFDDLSVVDEEEELRKEREKKEASEEGQRKLQNGDHPLPPSYLGQLHQNIPFYPATYDPPPCDAFAASSYYTECPFDLPADAPTETSALLAGMTSPCQTRPPFPDPLVPLTGAPNASTFETRAHEARQVLPAVQLPAVGWQNNILPQRNVNYSIPTTTVPSVSSRNDHQSFPSNVPNLSQRRNVLRHGKLAGNPFDESRAPTELAGNGWAFESPGEGRRMENGKESLPDAKILQHSVAFTEKPRHFFAPLPSRSRKEESPTGHFGTGNSSSSGKTGSTIVSREDRNNFSEKGSADVCVNGAISFDGNPPREDNRTFLSTDNLVVRDEPRCSGQLTKSVSCQDLTSDSQSATISEQLKTGREKPQGLTKSDNTLDAINGTSGRPFKSHLNVTLKVPRVPRPPLSPPVPEIPKLPSIDYRLRRNPFLRDFEEPVDTPFDRASPVTRPLSIQVNDNLGFHYPPMVPSYGRIQTEERYQRAQADRLLIPSDQLGNNVLPSVLSPISKDIQATSFERPSPRAVIPPVPPYDFNTIRRITANRYLQSQALYQNQIPFLPLPSHVCPQRGVRMYYENVPKVPAQTQTSIDGDSHHEDETPQDEESLSVPSSPSGQRKRRAVRKASSGTLVQRDQKPLSPAAQRRLRKQSSVTSSETPDSPGKLGRKARARKLSVTTTTTSEADKEDKNESRSSSSGQDSPRKDQTRRVSIYFNAKKRPSLTSVKTTRSGSLDAKDRCPEGGNLERDRTNSVGSREVGGKGRKASTSSGSVPWCACWGNGCI